VWPVQDDAVGTVHVVVPDGLDDPARPSGGNAYDRQVCRGLAATGWSVIEHPMPGPWPTRDAVASARLACEMAGLPDGAVVLLDGIVASTAPEVLVPEARRLRLVVLVHMPLGGGPAEGEVLGTSARERAVLSAAAAVVTTSTWTRNRLLDHYALHPGKVHVAEPGVDPAVLAEGTAAGGKLLCVAAVTPVKGHDVLLAALATVADLSWQCICVGSESRDPRFAARIRRDARECGIGGRVRFRGVLTGAHLNASYAAADLLVLASRAETYGMVVTEALARGLPVVATAVGGVPEALGHGAHGSRPGVLVPPGDPAAFGAALRDWLVDADLRRRLRRAARERRTALPGWSSSAAAISRVLIEAGQ
jgi:glycosyltransferase involved in cell wall biosynthesis